MNYRKKLLLLLGFSTLVRLLIAADTDLGNDEVYYCTYAQHLQLSYFDHPPMVAWLVRFTTADLLLHAAVFVRLGAVISSAICTLLVYKIGKLLHSRLAGWYAALLYTSSLYCSIIAGTFILPDSAQVVFWLGSLLLLLHIAALPVGTVKAKRLWYLFGLVAGLCIMSKVHGVFLWVGAGLYILFVQPAWLKYRAVYLAAALSLVVISPIIIWNIQNHFITYTYHGGRVSFVGASLEPANFIRELVGAILYNNPLNFFLVCQGLLAARAGRLQLAKSRLQITLFCGLPLILSLLFVSLFRETLPHWSGPGYTCLIFLPAILLAGKAGENKPAPALIKVALIIIGVVIVGGLCVINFYPGTLSGEKQGDNIGAGDPTLDLYGWKEAGEKINACFNADSAQHLMPAGTPIVVDNWFPGAHINFYVAAQTGQPTYALGNIFDLHHFHWLNQYKKPLRPGDTAWYIVPSNLRRQEALEAMKKRFDTMTLAAVIPQFRNGVMCRKFPIYRLNGYRGHNAAR